MAEFPARRVVVVAAIVGALVGGAVAGGLAVATTTGNNDNPTSSSGAASTDGTSAVVRTDLSTTVQIGGSIGYNGSYTVVAPSGSSALQVIQAEQTVTQDREALSGDEQAESDASVSDDQAIAAAQVDDDSDQSNLNSDEAEKTEECAGKGAPDPTCSQDAEKVSADQAELSQTQQQLVAAKLTATRDHDQNQAKVVSDKSKLGGDRATLTSLEETATDPGTTYTSLRQVGDVIKEDQAVYSVSDEPVLLLYGSIAAYRAFYVGMSDGADVGQLTRDLIALGYGAGMSESNHFSLATASAIERWQRGSGLPATGEILFGEVVFEPGPIRVTSVAPSIGESLTGAGGGGGGGTGSGTGAGTGSSTAAQSLCSSSGSGSVSNPTVTVTITLDITPELATLDQAPVNVNITSQQVDDVLAVPVNALLALAGGGFGVDVMTGRTSHLVGVTTGLYDNTLVQVSGSGISAGTLVEVPSS